MFLSMLQGGKSDFYVQEISAKSEFIFHLVLRLAKSEVFLYGFHARELTGDPDWPLGVSILHMARKLGSCNGTKPAVPGTLSEEFSR
jgi:hypothetical protein